MKTKNFLFKTAIVASTALSFLLGSCQKDDIDPVAQEPSNLFGKSSQSDISTNKKDRNILFISKRDAITTDEIYAMNTDGSNVVRLTNNDVPDGRAT